MIVDVYAVMLLILVFWRSNITQGFCEDYVSMEQVGHLRGIMAIMIVFHHLTPQVAEKTFFKQFSLVGYIICGFFFFWAGYGLYISCQNKKDYFANFLTKRIGKLMIPCFLVFPMYVAINYLLGNSLKAQLTDIINGTTIIENSWYVFVLLFLYLGFYFIYRSKSIKIIHKLLLIFLWTFSSILVLKYVLHWGLWWMNSSLSFVFGIFFANYEEKIISFFRKRYYRYTFILLISVLLLFVCNETKLAGNQTMIKIIAEQIVVMGMCFLLVLVCNKIKIGNKITKLLGEISYEIYLIHGFYILVFFRFVSVNIIVSIGLVLVSSILTAFYLHKLSKCVYEKCIENRVQQKIS